MSVILPFCELAEVPGVARGNQSYSHRLPALAVIYNLKYFTTLKWTHNKNIIHFSNRNLRQNGQEFHELWSNIDKTNKQPNIDYNFKYMDIPYNTQKKHYIRISTSSDKLFPIVFMLLKSMSICQRKIENIYILKFKILE